MLSVWLGLSISVRRLAKEHVIEELLCIVEFLVEVVATLSVTVLWLVATTTSSVLLLLSKASDAAELIVSSPL
jgi:hypothetical protein